MHFYLSFGDKGLQPPPLNPQIGAAGLILSILFYLSPGLLPMNYFGKAVIQFLKKRAE
jgi:hypothetical protein